MHSKKPLIDLMNACRGQRFTNNDFSLYDLNATDTTGMNGLLYSLKYNSTQGMKLTEKDFLYLIENTDLNYENLQGFNALIYALKNNKYERLCLKNDHFAILTKAIINEKTKMEKPSLIDNLLCYINQYELSIIWTHIEDKDWFCSYAQSINKYIVHLEEVKKFLEKRELEKSITCAGFSSAKIPKI